jgi:outer membrane protein with beta-barrel domain
MGTSARRRTTTRPAARTIVMALLAGGAIVRPAHAQGVVLGMLFGDRLATENFNIGIEIGMNLPTVSGLEGASLTRGVLFGLFASWRFSEHYHLYTGLLPLSSKGAKDADPIPLNDPELDPLFANGHMDRDLDYLDIPILIQVAQHRDGGFRAGLGPQFGIRTSAKDRYSGTTTQGTGIVIENDIGDLVERFDAGIAVDAEYRITGFGLAIGIRYYQGLTDLTRGSGPSMHNHVLSGSGRIALGGRKPKQPPEPK